ncbi:O-methyltransferase [Mycobacterium xenopi]|uniref:O-methyltransferase, family 3 n=1 Tax=Mycobacterium xenopi TaxID=1789 RepID=A0AAD1H4I0_MYCXE|nr:class I SAM-dependent methyltransferase [Mycobacterium xenopi]EID12575.1 O-methyltransferase, family protein 3 [Mycobacterium xenopi RIVM700367]MDA3641076.1 class I SAM-dependent methyltransferase [Mycobacterium xenopi]MDA3656530.1 class I SAM-dependent methyltransferase [Mycobacterium xenopi]MDA3662921.1 class I SAM-dependent methyltransferase [Mycobacterium xenopi]ORX20877.1 methyltransferase [Mycobacterium xenopi]
MANTLQDPKVATALERMYAESQEQVAQLRDWRDELQRLSSASAQERADAFGAFYIPVTPDAGRLLYMLVRAAQPTTIVEFGMSFGISAIHLASAVHDNGAGRVITTELSTAKIGAARKTFADIGLDDLITVLEGDALSTLRTVAGPVDFVLLDGWKDMYLPVVKLLEPQLSPGALIVADNTEMADTQPYLDYVRNTENGYVSVNFRAREADSMEISCRV